jgi:hypothetical protein
MKTEQPGSLSSVCALIGFVAFMFAMGCATTPVRPIQYPSSAKDWNGIDAVEFVQEWKLNDYSKLVVEPLDTSTTELPPKDENTYEPVIGVLKKTDGIVLSEIGQKLKGRMEVSGNKAEVSQPKRLVLRGRVADIHPGSQAARYFGGFGAGAAWVKITGELVDAQTGNVLLKFEQQRVGSVGMFGGSYDGLLTGCVVEIARDIGRMLTLFKTT